MEGEWGEIEKENDWAEVESQSEMEDLLQLRKLVGFAFCHSCSSEKEVFWVAYSAPRQLFADYEIQDPQA